MAKNTNPVLDAFRDSFDSYDPWGSAINAHFDIAECLYRYGAPIPTEWQFSPGLGAGGVFDEENESYFAAQIDLMMREGHYSNLVHAGNVLMRLCAQYKIAGLDY